MKGGEMVSTLTLSDALTSIVTTRHMRLFKFTLVKVFLKITYSIVSATFQGLTR